MGKDMRLCASEDQVDDVEFYGWRSVQLILKPLNKYPRLVLL